MTQIGAGSWVEIEQIVLVAGERAPQVPEDTASASLWLRTKGWLLVAGNVGEQVEIITVIGRRLSGKLVQANPGYPHGFGRPVPELLPIGQELRAMLEETDGQ